MQGGPEKKKLSPLKSVTEKHSPCLACVAAGVVSVVRFDVLEEWKHQTSKSCLLLRPTCDELCEQLVVAVDDVDRHVSGRLQEKRTALRRDAQSLSLCSWWCQYFNVQTVYKNRRLWWNRFVRFRVCCAFYFCGTHTCPTMQCTDNVRQWRELWCDVRNAPISATLHLERGIIKASSSLVWLTTVAPRKWLNRPWL